MKKNLIPIGLGSGIISQYSISEVVDQKKIDEYLLNNFKIIEEYLLKEKGKDEYAKKILESLKNNKKLNFIINKHLEIFIYKNWKDPIKVIKYVVFRFKFLESGKKKINLGYPPYILIEPVSTCNLRCSFCFQTDKSFTKKPFMGVMKMELFKKVVDEADNLGVGAITLASRGEPTLHKNFTQMLDYLSSKKNIFEIKINTNATFLTEEVSKSIFKNKVTQVVISADHYQKEEYERLRKNSNFEKILKNVDNLYNIRKLYKDNMTEIRISGVDADKNLNREKFKNFWITRSDHVTASYPFERWNTYENHIHEEINDPCENLWDRMYVWFDGKVNPCDADYKSYLSFGNLNDNSINEVWNHKKINKLRFDNLASKRKDYNPCDRCGASFK